MLKRLPRFFYEWIGFTTVDNLLFLHVKLKFHIRHTGTHTQVHFAIHFLMAHTAWVQGV